jgi:hypothetical protein
VLHVGYSPVPSTGFTARFIADQLMRPLGCGAGMRYGFGVESEMIENAVLPSESVTVAM